MSITNKVTIGLVSAVFAVSVVATYSVTAQDTVADLQAKIAQLIAQIEELKTLQSGRTTTVVASTGGGSAACPYTWTRNLAMGSSGDDVRQLQRFLNSNPQTQVAVSGVGSPGNETSYYGPATTRAVSKFQELYAAQILTPLGLTNGTGGFYTSTRTHANSICQSGSGSGSNVSYRTAPRSATSAPVVQVTGDALAVTPGNPISDAYVVKGAQRAPYTSIVLTAGTDDVRVEDVRIRRFGLSSSDNFESVALVNANGVQVGSARSLKRDEVSLGGSFVIPANRSVTLAVVGNMANTEDFSAGSIAGLEIAEVVANARVQGNFPIRGAAHVLSESITLQMTEVTVDGGGGDIPFNEETEIATVTIDLESGDADEEDAYLRSVILKQIGSANENEVGDIEITIDGDRVNHTLVVDRDRYIINFSGRGVQIEENDSVELRLETETNVGYEETVQFEIDDISDVYVVGASYGYGLPVKFALEGNANGDCVDSDPDCDEKDDDVRNTTESAMILSGEVRSGDRRLAKFEDEVRYGKDVILGALSVEFEGEDVEMEDLTFDVKIEDFPYTDETDNAWESADEDEVSFENIRMRINGETVAYADESVEFSSPTAAEIAADEIVETVDFSDRFIIEVDGDDEVETVFEIVADLDAAWSHFGGTNVTFTLTNVDEAEGLRSEKDYNEEGEGDDADGYFYSDREFKDVEITGNEITFEIGNDNVDGEEFVAGTEDVVFGTFSVDASNAVDDIELENLRISFRIPSSGTGNLSHIEDCKIIDESDDEVADGNSISGDEENDTDQMRFRFDNFVVESEDEVELDIVCAIDSKAEASDSYQIAADVNADDRIEYRIGRDDHEESFDEDNTSDIITVSEGGTLEVSSSKPNNESEIALVVGSGDEDIQTLELEFEAEDEDIRIDSLYLSGLSFGDSSTVDEAALKEFIDGITIEFEGGRSHRITHKKFEATGQKLVLGECENTDSDCEGTDTADITTDANVLVFENLGEEVEASETKTAVLSIDYEKISTNASEALSGQWLEAAKLYTYYEGESSGTLGQTTTNVASHFSKNVVFPTLPTISSSRKNDDGLSGNDVELYEFTVNANSAGDLYVRKLTFSITPSSGVTLNNVRVTKDGSTISTNSHAVTTATDQEFVIDEDETEIRKGSSEEFSVVADVTGATNGSDVTTELLHDTTAPSTLGQAAASVTGSFVWSPDTLRENGSLTVADWFSGWAVFDGDDTKSWTIER